MQRIRVGEGIDIGDLPVQGEFLNFVDIDLKRLSGACPAAVTTAINEDAHHPCRGCGFVVKLVESPEGFEQALLNGVFGIISGEASCDRVKARKLIDR